MTQRPHPMWIPIAGLIGSLAGVWGATVTQVPAPLPEPTKPIPTYWATTMPKGATILMATTCERLTPEAVQQIADAIRDKP